MFIDHNVICEDQADGTKILTSGLSLGHVVNDTNQWLEHWAETAPDRVFLAERAGEGWATITFADMWAKTQSVAQGLLNAGLTPGQHLIVLSGPSIHHGILMQACQMIGVIIAPMAEQYSLIPSAHGRLIYCAEKVNAPMVYAADGDMFADALSLPVFKTATKLTSTGGGDVRFHDLLATWLIN